MGASVSTQGTYALDSAYTYGTNGDAIHWSFILPETLTLESVYIVPLSITGTGSDDSNINWELREGTTATANVPGTTVVASGTIAVSALSANTFYKFTLPSSQTITAYKIYYFILGDADGSATNYVTLYRDIRENGSLFFNSAYSTTNGFTTAPTSSGYQPCCVFKFTDGTVIGASFIRASTNNTNNTNLRGIKITTPSSGPQIKITGATFISGTFRVLKGSGALPNTTADKTWTFSSNFPTAGANPGYFFTEEECYVMYPGETYFLLWKPSSSSAGPSKTTAFSGMDSDLRSILGGYNGMSCSHVQEATSTTWTEDTDPEVNRT